MNQYESVRVSNGDFDLTLRCIQLVHHPTKWIKEHSNITSKYQILIIKAKLDFP